MLIAKVCQIKDPDIAISRKWHCRKQKVGQKHDIKGLIDALDLSKTPICTLCVNYRSAINISSEYGVTVMHQFVQLSTADSICSILIPPPLRVDQTSESTINIELASVEESDSPVLTQMVKHDLVVNQFIQSIESFLLIGL